MKNVDKLIARAIECAKSGDLARAEKIARTILEDDPKNFDALHIYGNARLERDDLRSATSLLTEVVRLDPSFPPAQMNLANCLAGSDQHAEALPHFDFAIKLRPNYAEAIYNRALSLKELDRTADAVKSLREAASASLGEARIYKLLSDLLIESDQLDEASKALDAGLADLPKSPDLLNCMGCLLLRQKNESEAAEYFARSRKLAPPTGETRRRRAEAYAALGRFDEAVEEYSLAIVQEPADAKLYRSRGEVFQQLHKDVEASLDLGAAYSVYMRNAHMRTKRGNLHAALRDLDSALELREDDLEALNTRGNVFNEMAKYPSALKDFEAARRLGSPADPLKLGLICHLKCRTADWPGLAELVDEVSELGRAGAGLSPFHLIPLTDDPELHHHVTRTIVNASISSFKARPFGPAAPRRKINIGYFSEDFYAHPVLQLIRGVFSNHDRERFHVAAFSLTKNKDANYHEIKTTFDAFHNVEDATDDEITTLARKEKVDIAIDLTGLTNASRFGIFAARAAPVQVNFLGYPGTMGADFMDYIIADPVIIPEGLREHYSEKVAYMPCYQPNDRLRPPHRPERRSDHKLPENGFVFCCFNDTYKILPGRFELWMRILKQVEGSILWLLARDPHTEANFAKEAAAHGIGPDRIIFAARQPHDLHISRHQLVDIFLDTGPYNAHTTSSDALWAGVPVLTLAGRSFAARVAASLVTRAGVPELVTTSDEEYVSLAVRLAHDPAMLESIKNKIRAARTESPLFDVVRFTRDLEQLYEEMNRRRLEGLPPDHIVLPGA